MRYVLALCIATVVNLAPAFAATEARLLRFPAIHDDQIVFTYAGDLYTVGSNGGVARKLTNDEGFEMFARFSPDGKTLAFTGQYDGNTEVYTMPAAGGIPQRLTYTATLGRDDVADRMGPNNIVMAWTPDGRRVIFRSRMHSFNSFLGRLYAVPTSGEMPEELPLPRAGFCSYSPDGKKLAYNRVFREFRTWKRYRGGMADDIWVYDFDAKTTENITNNAAQDIIPMWRGDEIFFLSDRDDNKRMNLFVYDTNTKETKQLTQFTEFDVKFPSLGPKAIVFENGGYIYRYDIERSECTKVSIFIEDDLQGGRGGLVGVADKVTSYEVSPDGKRAVFGARGDVFTVPAKHGAIRNLTSTPGAHERDSVWSPDGKWVAYISDASGEDEIWVVPQDGRGEPRQVSHDDAIYKYRIAWSPDSKKILWADKALRLRFVNVETGKITDVCKCEKWEFSDYAWSPDSQWIVYAKAEVAGMSKIYLYSLKNQTSHELTDGWYDSSSPIFSSDGRFVFFVSERDFNPIYSSTEWNHAYQEMSRVYLITLARSTPSPFKPKSDEVEIKAEEPKKETAEPNDPNQPAKDDAEKSKEDEKSESKAIKVDLDGIKDRIAVLPIGVSSYRHLGSVDDLVYYQRHGQLCLYDLKEQKETELGNARGYEISADRKKMLVAADGKYAILDLPRGKFEMKGEMDLSGMQVQLDKRAEWRQIFNECWRQMRDFFHVPNMHGVDWAAMRARYEPLVAHVNHRADLTYVIGEMISELNIGHAYVGGGECPQPERISMGLLGAELTRDTQTGYYRIAKVLRGENWVRDTRSPLTEIGVDANEGDFILAVDGRSTANVKNLYELLVNKAGKQVSLKLNSKPELEGSRETIVVPTDSEENLYYYQWVQGNIDKVAKATNGKVGYVHVPDMSSVGLNEFVKHFYPQIRKKALIIDVRGNGGGNVSPMLIERLRREIAMVEFARNAAPTPDPEAMIYGPLVCLADEFSASDGDLFTYQFKHYKLGKVIGKRTWGGVVGIRGSLPLLDGSSLNKPEFSRYDVEGKNWIIEGVGVEPDIVVDNDPAQEYAGVDQQLDKAIEVILEELKTKEKEIPPLPPYPVK